MRKFELLKDLPDAKVGTIIKQEKENGLYFYKGIHDDGDESWYIPEAVENNPEWFREIVEKEPFVWDDISVANFFINTDHHGPTIFHDMEKFKLSKQSPTVTLKAPDGCVGSTEEKPLDSGWDKNKRIEDAKQRCIDEIYKILYRTQKY